MPTVKCLNPQCDYFQKPIPDGDFCPFCGEPINLSYTPAISTVSPQLADPSPSPIPTGYPLESPPLPPPAPPVKPTPNKPGVTMVEEPSPRLNIVHTTSAQKFTIDKETAINKIYLGRPDYSESLPAAVIDLSTIPYGERISRSHAYVYWDVHQQCYMIVDNNSTNGTILNGISLIANQPYPLKQGDKIALGKEQKVVFTIEINLNYD